MFSAKTVSTINSMQIFGQNRKGVIRVYFPDKTYRDISAPEIAQMTFGDFVAIAMKLDERFELNPPSGRQAPFRSKIENL